MHDNAALSLTMQEASFKEFLARPENQDVLEKQQRKEAKQAIQLQEKMRALEFREKARPGINCTTKLDRVDQHKGSRTWQSITACYALVRSR